MTAEAQEFRTGVTLRIVDVVVTDSSGRPARGLGPDDFQITEDGRPVTVKLVTDIEVPDVMASPGSRVTDVRDPLVWTNRGVAARRVFAVVLDDLNTRANDIAKARSAVQAFIDRLPERDLASVVFTGQQTGAQEFTSDKARLAHSLRQYTGRHAIADLDLVSDAPSDFDGAMRGTLGGEVRGNRERMLRTMLNVTEWLSGIQDRRKSILLVTAGLEPALAPAFFGALGNGTFAGAGAGPLFAQLVARAAEANVAIYPLDYRGLSGPIGRSGDPSDSGGLNPLIVMADETGGVAGVNNNNPGPLFDRLIQDASAYYLVAYEPAVSARPDKKARAYRLRVRMRSDTLSARARHTYVSRPANSTADRKATTAQLLSSPLPGGALAVHVQVSAFPKGNGQSRAVVVLEVSGETLTQGTPTSDGTLDVKYRIAATDVNGRVEASDAQDVVLRLSAERLTQITKQSLRVFSHLDLAPGSYRVRASVVHGDSNGVVAGDVEIPDYRNEPFTVSQPLVASSETATTPVRREDYQPFKGRLSSAPTAQRVFGARESLEVYVEVHMPIGKTSRRVIARVPIARAVITDLFRKQVAEVPTQVGAAGKGLAGGQIYPVTAAYSFSGLPAGQYELEMSLAVEGQAAVTRSVAFRLR